MTNVCYFCGQPATSDEHVPPKALFPKLKDSQNGHDYRKNLITVRSCEEHNSAKSRDDEYLLYVLAMCLPSNNVAKNQFLTKVRRAINYKPKLMNSLLIKIQSVFLHDTASNTLHKSIAIKPNYERLISIFEHISKAIYFFETGRVWQGKTSVLIEFMLSLTDLKHNQKQSDLEKAANDCLAAIPHKGDHPDVFSYQFVIVDGNAMMRFHFYGNSKVLVAHV